MIHCAAFSAIMSVGELVLPLVMSGMTPASTTKARHAAHSSAHRPQPVVVCAAHLGGTHRVKNGGGDITGQAC